MTSCKSYPEYKGIRPPTCGCDACRERYNARHLVPGTMVQTIKGDRFDKNARSRKMEFVGLGGQWREFQQAKVRIRLYRRERLATFLLKNLREAA